MKVVAVTGVGMMIFSEPEMYIPLVVLSPPRPLQPLGPQQI